MSRKILNITEKKLGDRLKQVRLAKDLTQQAFAESLDTSASYISDIEAGKTAPGSKFLTTFLRKFNINLNWLLTGEGEMFLDESKKVVPVEDIPKEKMKTWIDEFWQNASEDEKAWLRIEFQRAFPEFKEWLIKKQREVETEQFREGRPIPATKKKETQKKVLFKPTGTTESEL
jgi:transcriptional regulator with XRE-family HTH domain